MGDEAVAKRLKREEYLALAPSEFRAFFRQRIHILVEKNLYGAVLNDKKITAGAIEMANELVSIWLEKGLPEDAPDFLWGREAIRTAENWARGTKPDLFHHRPYQLLPSEVEAFDRVVRERRSVRAWSQRYVADETVDLLLEAGIWAANSCNQQAVRYIVVREENAPRLVPVNIPYPGPVHILILQDERNYNANSIMPVRNRLLDAGAVAQNIVLTAHAHGLAGVWLTYSDQAIRKLRDHFQLEDYLKIITLVDVGYPGYAPPPVARMGLGDILLRRI